MITDETDDITYFKCVLAQRSFIGVFGRVIHFSCSIPLSFYTLYNQIGMEVHVVCLAMCFGTYMYMYMLLLFCVFSISHPSAIETLVFLLIASLVHYYHSNSSHVLTM
jgi:hypothetical protein